MGIGWFLKKLAVPLLCKSLSKLFNSAHWNVFSAGVQTQDLGEKIGRAYQVWLLDHVSCRKNHEHLQAGAAMIMAARIKFGSSSDPPTTSLVGEANRLFPGLSSSQLNNLKQVFLGSGLQNSDRKMFEFLFTLCQGSLDVRSALTIPGWTETRISCRKEQKAHSGSGSSFSTFSFDPIGKDLSHNWITYWCWQLWSVL